MLRAILATTASQAVLLLLQMTAIVVTAHFLGPEGRGAYGVVVTWALLIASCASFSLDSAMPKRASAGEADWFASLFAATVRLWVWLSLFGLLGALALYVIFGQTLFAGVEPLALLLGLLALPVLIWGRYQTSLLLAAGFLGLRNRNQIVGALANTLGVIILVVVIPGSVLGALAAFLISAVLQAAIGFAPLMRRAGPSWWRKNTALKSLFKDGAKAHLATVGHVAHNSLDVITLNAYLGTSAVGLYQMALKLIDTILQLPFAVGLVFRSRQGGQQPGARWRDERKHVLATLAILCCGGVVAWFLAPWLIPLVLGEAFLPSVEIFQFLLPIILGRGFEALLVPQILARGYLKSGAALSLVLAAGNVLLLLWLVPAKGLEGAMLAALITFAIAPFLLYCGWFWWFDHLARKEKA